MGLFSWLFKLGAPGETARTVTSQYKKLKQEHPNFKDNQIYELIIEARQAAVPYEHYQLEEIKELMGSKPSPFQFVVKLIVIDTNITYSNFGDVDSFLKARTEVENIVGEEFQKQGLKI